MDAAVAGAPASVGSEVAEVTARWMLAWGMLAAFVAPGARGQVNVGTNQLPGGQGATVGTSNDTPAEQLAHMAERCRLWLDRARKEIEAQRWVRAIDALEKARANNVSKELLQQQQALWAQVEAQGQAELKAAEANYTAGKYAAALEALGRVSRVYGMLPSGKAARRALDEAESDPLARAALRDTKAREIDRAVQDIIDGHYLLLRRRAIRKARREGGGKVAASRPAAQADPSADPDEETPVAADMVSLPSRPAGRVEQLRSLPPLHRRRAVTMLRQIAKVYGDTPTGVRAAADLKAYDRAHPASRPADEATVAGRRSEANRLYQRAEAYRNVRHFGRAKELYRQIVRKHPDSPEAAKAKAHLASLPGE